MGRPGCRLSWILGAGIPRGAGLQSELIGIQVAFPCGRGWGTAVGPVAEESHYLEISVGGGACTEAQEGEEQQERQPQESVYREEAPRSSRAWRRDGLPGGSLGTPLMPKQAYVLSGETLADSWSAGAWSSLPSFGKLLLDLSPNPRTSPAGGDITCSCSSGQHVVRGSSWTAGLSAGEQGCRRSWGGEQKMLGWNLPPSMGGRRASG